MNERTAALLGEETVTRLKTRRILVVGVGGVGSWCAEALLRTGVGHLTLVDDDTVASSNLNRQCEATAATVGAPKAAAMRERLLAIDPSADVTALAVRWTPAARPCDVRDFDGVVDAIDSVDAKADLILAATEAGVPLVSSLGAALRTDPTKVTLRRFDKVTGDGLARALRARFRKLARFPAAKFVCACSDETPRQAASGAAKGSVMTVTAAFGMALAAEMISILTTGTGKMPVPQGGDRHGQDARATWTRLSQSRLGFRKGEA